MSATTTINPVLEIRRVFDAPPDVAFDAWLEREQWQAWIGPEGCRCDVPLLEPKVGGRYRIVNLLPDGTTLAIEGTFELIDAPHKLVYTWRMGQELPESSRVTVRFEQRGQATEVIVVHEQIPTAAVRDSHEHGWNGCLDKLSIRAQAPSHDIISPHEKTWIA